MANIRVDLDYTLQDGAEVKFRSPVDCSQVTGLIVYYPGADGITTSKVFTLSDAHGNNVGDIDHLFAENVVVKVILDVTTGMAFVQNADTNKYLESRINKAAPVNLLDNSDFRNPVNQRGNTSFSQRKRYWIDRWFTENDVYLDIKTGCIGINATGSNFGGLVQKTENLSLYDGKKLTLAVCAKSNGGKLRLAFPYVGEKANIQLNNAWGIYTYTVTFRANQENSIGIYSESGLMDVQWAALYEGEYTAETLPEYHTKGYAHELLECQRYYLHSIGFGSPVVFQATNNVAFVNIYTPVKMRTNPTATILTTDSIVTKDWTGGVVGIASVEIHEHSIVVAAITNGTPGNWVTGVSYGVTFALSADL